MCILRDKPMVDAAEYDRLRAATEGDPTSIYHEAAELRQQLQGAVETLRKIADVPLLAEMGAYHRAIGEARAYLALHGLLGGGGG